VARSLALPRPPQALSAAVSRYWPFALLLLAALALVVAEFLTLRYVQAITAVVPGGVTTGGAHHGYALAVLGVASVPMAVGAALGGSRPAAIAVTAIGCVALFIVLAIDLPNLHDAGRLPDTFEAAKAHAGVGFWIELLAAIGLVIGGLAVLRRTAVARRPARRRRPAVTE
jgi:hypothetical protein